MTVETQEKASARPSSLESKLKAIEALYADAPELAREALRRLGPDLASQIAPRGEDTPEASTAGRIGRRQGLVSELTVLAPLAKGGGKRLRGLLELLDGHFEGADRVGTVHDMRFV